MILGLGVFCWGCSVVNVIITESIYSGFLNNYSMMSNLLCKICLLIILLYLCIILLIMVGNYNLIFWLIDYTL